MENLVMPFYVLWRNFQLSNFSFKLLWTFRILKNFRICVRISKCKSLFGNVYTSNWSEEVFVIEKVKNTVLLTYVIEGLNGEKIVRTFYEK